MIYSGNAITVTKTISLMDLFAQSVVLKTAMTVLTQFDALLVFLITFCLKETATHGFKTAKFLKKINPKTLFQRKEKVQDVQIVMKVIMYLKMELVKNVIRPVNIAWQKTFVQLVTIMIFLTTETV